MRAFRLLAAVVVILSLSGCAPKPDPLMPEVVGLQLDVAKSDVKRAGVGGDVEVLGGGLFGVLDESNWQVCEQLPAAGEVVTITPRLTVDRACEGTAPQASDAPSESAPEPTPSPEPTEPPSDPEPTEQPQDPDPTEPATGPSAVDADEVEETYKEHLRNNFIDSISDMCDESRTHWACFYDGVESGGDYLQVNLTTDGGWSDEDLSDMADSAGEHWFNFIGCDFPDLETIVVTINGLDHNVFRWDTEADSFCD